MTLFPMHPRFSHSVIMLLNGKWCLLFVLMPAIFGSVRGNPEVTERNSTYDCCERLEIPFDEKCDNTWSKDEKNFAIYVAHESSHKCSSPCKEIRGGLMTLDQRATGKVVTVCRKGMVIVKDERTRFFCQTCPGSQKSTGNLVVPSFGLLLPCLIMGFSGLKILL